jgi:outer membrane protein assembly factor BamB
MIADRTIIVLQGTRPGNLIAINKETGEVVWRYDEPGIVSNISLGQQRSTAYFLNAEAHLLAVDANTGEILDSIVFIGDDFEEYDNTVDSPLNFVASPFSVVAWENIVVVLLGDSAELFAFRFSPY